LILLDTLSQPKMTGMIAKEILYTIHELLKKISFHRHYGMGKGTISNKRMCDKIKEEIESAI